MTANFEPSSDIVTGPGQPGSCPHDDQVAPPSRLRYTGTERVLGIATASFKPSVEDVIDPTPSVGMARSTHVFPASALVYSLLPAAAANRMPSLDAASADHAATKLQTAGDGSQSRASMRLHCQSPNMAATHRGLGNTGGGGAGGIGGGGEGGGCVGGGPGGDGGKGGARCPPQKGLPQRKRMPTTNPSRRSTCKPRGGPGDRQFAEPGLSSVAGCRTHSRCGLQQPGRSPRTP